MSFRLLMCCLCGVHMTPLMSGAVCACCSCRWCARSAGSRRRRRRERAAGTRCARPPESALACVAPTDLIMSPGGAHSLELPPSGIPRSIRCVVSISRLRSRSRSRSSPHRLDRRSGHHRNGQLGHQLWRSSACCGLHGGSLLSLQQQQRRLRATSAGVINQRTPRARAAAASESGE
jgi:hypothetical protein